jgi:PST family polysaccharide transporter
MNPKLKFVKNVFSLGSVNALAMLINIVSMPIIIRSLGIDGYGTYIYIFIQCQFLALIVNYSFDMFAITEARGIEKKANSLVSKIIIIRLLLFANFSFIAYFFIVYNLDEVNHLSLLALIISVFPLCFNLSWYFQSMEKMEYIAFSNLSGKLVYVCFLLMPIEKDVVYFATAYLISNVITAMIYVYFLYKKCNVNLYFCFDGIRDVFLRSTSFFGYQLAVGALPTINSSLANKYGGGNLVTSFDLFNKFASSLNIMTGVVIQAIYPKIVASKKVTEIKILLTTFVSFLCVFVLFFALLIYMLSDHIDGIMYYLFKGEVQGLFNIFMLGLIFVFFCSLNSMLSRVLIFYGRIKVVNYSTAVALLSAVAVTPLFLKYYQTMGLFFGMITSQLIISAVTSCVLWVEIRARTLKE